MSRSLRGLAGSLALLLAAACTPAKPAVEQRIVLITLDTLRADRLASAMPRSLAFAEEGRIFERAYAATSTTQPTHASLFTGLHPWQHGVVRNGIVLAEDGAKMSKSLRNFPDPNIVLHKYGADALRVYLVDSPVVNAKDLRFSEEGVQERVRSVMLPLWNAYSFLTKYADVDGWEPDGVAPDPSVNELDGWVLSRLQTLVRAAEEQMEAYALFRVVPALLDFIDELTNWYIRRSRRRFWRGAGEDDADKQNAYRTLHHVLLTLARALAPFLPFISEEIYGNLSAGQGRDSVHLDDYPVANAAFEDAGLEQRMGVARTAVGLGRGLRAKHDVRVRQPLPRMTVVSSSAEVRAALERVQGLIADELNVKEVLVSADEGEFVTYSARPNLPVLGPKYGKQLGAIKREVAGLGSDALTRVLAGEALPSDSVEGLVYDGETLIVDRASKEGTVVATEEGITVALDLEVTPELRREGLAREVVNRVQGLRKERDFALDDRIDVTLECTGDLADSIREHWSLIRAEILAVGDDPGLVEGLGGDDVASFDVEGEALRVRVACRS